MLGYGDARKYNLISLIFVSLSVIWLIVVVVMLFSG
jgi:hypothetical protein